MKKEPKESNKVDKKFTVSEDEQGEEGYDNEGPFGIGQLNAEPDKPKQKATKY